MYLCINHVKISRNSFVYRCSSLHSYPICNCNTFYKYARFHGKLVTFETEGKARTAQNYFAGIGRGCESKPDFSQNVLQDPLCLRETPKMFAHGVQCWNYTERNRILSA